MNRTTALTALTAATALALAACGASGSTTAGSPTATATSTSSPAASSSAASSPAGTPTPTSKPVAAGGACTLIDADTAAQVLGSPLTKTTPGSVGTTTDSDGTLTKLDGCLYSSAAGSLGYDVVKFSELDSQQMFAMAKAKAGAQLKAGKATQFTPSTPDALGYTIPLPLGTDSIISTAKNGWLITVSVGAKTQDPKVSAQKADVALTALLGRL